MVDNDVRVSSILLFPLYFSFVKTKDVLENISDKLDVERMNSF